MGLIMAIAEELNVLILSGWVDQAFTFVRSFSKQKHINMFVADCWPNSPCGHSRYCKRFHLIPGPEEPEHIPAILAVCREEEIDVVLPVQHDEIIAVSKNQELFESVGIRLPFPSYPLMELTVDKYRMAKIARESGIPVPETYLLSEIDPRDLGKKIGFPVLTKLRNGTGQRGQKRVQSTEEFEVQVHSLLQEYDEEEIIVQEYIPGSVQDTMYTVGLLYNHNHELRACVPLKKIRSKSYTGGTAICTKAENRPDVKEMAIRLMNSLGKWEGIADVEIKIDPRDGKPKFIELNPRPWGSMYGAQAAGVDFPMLWVKVALREDFDPIDEFEENVYVSFLTRDLLLLVEIVEKLFSRERGEVWRVLKTYSRPYFRRNKNFKINVTSDFILSDLGPFIKNVSRVKGNLLPRIWTR